MNIYIQLYTCTQYTVYTMYALMGSVPLSAPAGKLYHDNMLSPVKQSMQ